MTPVPVERSPADVLRLVVAGALLVALALVDHFLGDTLAGFAADALRGLDAFPAWMVDVVLVGVRVLAVLVLGSVLVYAVSGHRWRMLVTVVAAGVGAGLVAWATATWRATDAGRVVVANAVELGPLTDPGAPGMVGIAVVAAVATAAAPWMGRWTRRGGTILVLALVVIAFASAPASARSLLGATIGWVVGSAVLVAAGAPSRRPLPDSIASGLADVGLPTSDLQRAGVDARGSTPYFGVAADGSRCVRQGARCGRAQCRPAVPHVSAAPSSPPRRRAAVRHAGPCGGARGVRRPPCSRPRRADPRAAGGRAPAAPNGHVLAYEAIAGRSLDQVDRDALDDDVMREVWVLVGRLRAHRIADRDPRLANIFLADDGVVHLIDFGFAEVTASDLLLATDVAELIAVVRRPDRCGTGRRSCRGERRCDDPRLVPRRGLRGWALSGATGASLAHAPS